MNEEKIIKRLSAVGIWGNVALSIFKFYAGIVGRSQAMTSDAVHSCSDVAATFIAWLGVKLSKRPADAEHPYGHERFECVASLILGCILFAAGYKIGKTGLDSIFSGDYKTASEPALLPLIAAIVSIVVKEGMYRYTMRYAKLMNSSAFKADAWHHRTDAFSSVGSFIGVGAARLGFPIMDSVASLGICLCIFKVAYDIVRNTISEMLDASCGPDYETAIREYVLSHKDVIKIDLLHTRKFGNKVYVDLEISMDQNCTLLYAHSVAEDIHSGIEERFSDVKHIMVHVNPS